jgi:hypothetical protein
VEVQQEQQQRRHPQHLHQQHHGDAAQHTRTWKLQSDRYGRVGVTGWVWVWVEYLWGVCT